MNKEQVKSILRVQRGYLKANSQALRNKFHGTSFDLIREAIREVNKEIVEEYTKREIVQEKASNEEIKPHSIEETEIYKKFLELSDELKKYSVKKSKPVDNDFIVKETKQIIKSHQQQGLHIVLGCAHIPFENKTLLNGIVNFIKELGDKVSGFHIIGDYLDLNSLSFHDKGLVPIPGITLGFEYQKGNEWLDKFESVLNPNAEKTYIYGNHEDRYLRHIHSSDNSKYADALLSPKKGLKLEERGFKVYERWKDDFHQIGKLELLHGEYCTATPAKTHLQRIKKSCMFAHTHRVDIHYDGNNAAFNIGSAADFTAEAFNYAGRLTKMNWLNGFGLVQVDSYGYFHGQVITAINGKFWYNGKEF